MQPLTIRFGRVLLPDGAMTVTEIALQDGHTLDATGLPVLPRIVDIHGAAAGLADRGAIAPGLRGDIVLVDPAVPRIVATLAQGNIAYLSADGAARLLG